MTIGVFDSGHGGLTILDALAARFPGQDFLYLGDHERAPYGNGNAEATYLFTKDSVAWLFDQGCNLVILACNTASAVALRRLQQTWLPLVYPEHRVLGVLVPMVEELTGRPWHVTYSADEAPEAPAAVAIFATPQTVATDAYRREVALRSPTTNVLQQPCKELVPAIEAFAPRSELRKLVEGYVRDLLAQEGAAAASSVVLGCTHYQLCADLFRAALPAGVSILNQPQIVAESLAGHLRRHPQFARVRSQELPRLVTSGEPETVSKNASLYLGRPVSFVGLGDWSRAAATNQSRQPSDRVTPN